MIQFSAGVLVLVPGIFDGLDVVPHAACACAIVKGIKSPELFHLICVNVAVAMFGHSPQKVFLSVAMAGVLTHSGLFI